MKSDEEIRKEFYDEFVADNGTSWKVPSGVLFPDDVVGFILRTVASVRQEEREALREEVKNYKSSIREAEPYDEYEKGYDHGWDDAKNDITSLLDKK